VGGEASWAGRARARLAARRVRAEAEWREAAGIVQGAGRTPPPAGIQASPSVIDLDADATPPGRAAAFESTAAAAGPRAALDAELASAFCHLSPPAFHMWASACWRRLSGWLEEVLLGRCAASRGILGPWSPEPVPSPAADDSNPFVDGDNKESGCADCGRWGAGARSLAGFVLGVCGELLAGETGIGPGAPALGLGRARVRLVAARAAALARAQALSAAAAGRAALALAALVRDGASVNPPVELREVARRAGRGLDPQRARTDDAAATSGDDNGWGDNWDGWWTAAAAERSDWPDHNVDGGAPPLLTVLCYLECLNARAGGFPGAGGAATPLGTSATASPLSTAAATPPRRRLGRGKAASLATPPTSYSTRPPYGGGCDKSAEIVTALEREGAVEDSLARTLRGVATWMPRGSDAHLLASFRCQSLPPIPVSNDEPNGNRAAQPPPVGALRVLSGGVVFDPLPVGGAGGSGRGAGESSAWSLPWTSFAGAPIAGARRGEPTLIITPVEEWEGLSSGGSLEIGALTWGGRDSCYAAIAAACAGVDAPVARALIAAGALPERKRDRSAERAAMSAAVANGEGAHLGRAMSATPHSSPGLMTAGALPAPPAAADAASPPIGGALAPRRRTENADDDDGGCTAAAAEPSGFGARGADGRGPDGHWGALAAVPSGDEVVASFRCRRGDPSGRGKPPFLASSSLLVLPLFHSTLSSPPTSPPQSHHPRWPTPQGRCPSPLPRGAGVRLPRGCVPRPPGRVVGARGWGRGVVGAGGHGPVGEGAAAWGDGAVRPAASAGGRRPWQCDTPLQETGQGGQRAPPPLARRRRVRGWRRRGGGGCGGGGRLVGYAGSRSGLVSGVVARGEADRCGP